MLINNILCNLCNLWAQIPVILVIRGERTLNQPYYYGSI